MKLLLRVGAALAAVGMLTACGSPAAPQGLSVVASTDVYGAIASAVGGNTVAVTSIIHSADADPHEYEATPTDALAVGRGDRARLQRRRATTTSPASCVDASSTKPTAVDVSALSGLDTAVPDFNEHVWYSLPTVKQLADTLATDLGAADPPNAAAYTANAKAFDAQVDGHHGARSTRSRRGTPAPGSRSPSRSPGYLLAGRGAGRRDAAGVLAGGRGGHRPAGRGRDG